MISPEYLAGFFDGEGSVGIYKSRNTRARHLVATVSNTNLPFMELLHAEFGGVVMRRKPDNPKWSESMLLTWNGKKAIEFLTSIRPHVRIKKAQVELAFEFWEYKQKHRPDGCRKVKCTPAEYDIEELLGNTMRTLKERGGSDSMSAGT